MYSLRPRTRLAQPNLKLCATALPPIRPLDPPRMPHNCQEHSESIVGSTSRSLDLRSEPGAQSVIRVVAAGERHDIGLGLWRVVPDHHDILP
jgi:hypothetical protein